MVNKLLSETKVCVSVWQNIVTIAREDLDVDKASVRDAKKLKSKYQVILKRQQYLIMIKIPILILNFPGRHKTWMNTCGM